MFSAITWSDLQHHRPIGQGGLSGEKDPSSDAMPQFCQEPKAAQKIPSRGENASRRGWHAFAAHRLRPDSARSAWRRKHGTHWMAQDIFQSLLPLREALGHLQGGLI